MKYIFFVLISALVLACDDKNDLMDNVFFTSVPDPNFENTLIELGYDSYLDGKVLTAKIKEIDYLDLSNKNIKDLKGIESFTLLKILICNGNQLSNLDISNNKELVVLECWGNLLTEIDLSNNSNLQILVLGNNLFWEIDVSLCSSLSKLVVSENFLNEIDLSKNSKLKELWIDKNKIETLDLSGCPNLSFLNVCFNGFTYLDVSGNLNLKTLWCTDNQLIKLDVSKNISLLDLKCYGNKLIGLNVKNGVNKAMSEFMAFTNKLKCIQVDDPDWALIHWKYKVDAGVVFSNDTTY